MKDEILLIYEGNYNMKLQPLRIPAGWNVSYNQFYELDPQAVNKIEDTETRDYLETYFDEDMFQAKNIQRGFLIDIGWTKSRNLSSGNFYALLLKGTSNEEENMEKESEIIFDWSNPINSFKGNNLNELILFLETTMRDVSDGKYNNPS